jgi:hypothetical protein
MRENCDSNYNPQNNLSLPAATSCAGCCDDPQGEEEIFSGRRLFSVRENLEDNNVN